MVSFVLGALSEWGRTAVFSLPQISEDFRYQIVAVGSLRAHPLPFLPPSSPKNQKKTHTSRINHDHEITPTGVEWRGAGAVRAVRRGGSDAHCAEQSQRHHGLGPHARNLQSFSHHSAITHTLGQSTLANRLWQSPTQTVELFNMFAKICAMSSLTRETTRITLHIPTTLHSENESLGESGGGGGPVGAMCGQSSGHPLIIPPPLPHPPIHIFSSPTQTSFDTF